MGTIELFPACMPHSTALTNVADYGSPMIAGTGSAPSAIVITWRPWSERAANDPLHGLGGPGALTPSNLTVANPAGDNQNAISRIRRARAQRLGPRSRVGLPRAARSATRSGQRDFLISSSTLAFAGGL